MLSQLREQFLNFWSSQSRTQRLVLIGLVLTGLVMIVLFITWASSPTYEVAFSGLSEADAGEIVEKLTGDGIPYQLRGSGTILVPSDNVHEVRLSMARQGLPQGSTVGFELFSGNTLGMTEFTQRVNFRRALEGELERTIGSLNVVRAVRVHIVTPEKTLLSGDQVPATASVTLQINPASQIDTARVRAITHLVASSVEGLQSENVVVVDVDGNLLATGGVEDGLAALTAQSEGRRTAEAAYAARIQSNVRDLLDRVLGPNKSVVQASVAMDWTQKDVTTQSFDPASSAIRSSQALTETFAGNDMPVGGIPGAESNLPPATGAEITGTEASQYQRFETTTNYEITQIQSHEVVTPGRIERISLSVLVDGITDTVQLASLQSAIVAAVGIDETRGDALAVETLPFDRSFYQQQAADLARSAQMELYVKIAAWALAALLLVAFLWYVQRLLTKLRLASTEAWRPVLMPVSRALPEAAAALPEGLEPPPTALPATAPRPSVEEEQKRAEEEQKRVEEEQRKRAEEKQLHRILARLVEEEPITVAEVIHLWLREDEHAL